MTVAASWFIHTLNVEQPLPLFWEIFLGIWHRFWQMVMMKLIQVDDRQLYCNYTNWFFVMKWLKRLKKELIWFDSRRSICSRNCGWWWKAGNTQYRLTLPANWIITVVNSLLRKKVTWKKNKGGLYISLLIILSELAMPLKFLWAICMYGDCITVWELVQWEKVNTFGVMFYIVRNKQSGKPQINHA